MAEGTTTRSLMRQIDGYCERVSPDFWAEPVNAVTNIAFLLAGFLALRLALREGRVDGPVIFLSLNAIAVGIGSFLFHTFATVWAAMMDSGPIMIFILGYFAIAMNRFVGLSWWRSALAVVGFLVAMVAVSWVLNMTLRPIIGGTVSYFPAFFALLGVGAWLASKGHGAGQGLMAAGGVFAVSLTFRALDGPVCTALPLGTHFLWHLCNGLVLWLLITTLIRHGRAPEPRTRVLATA